MNIINRFIAPILASAAMIAGSPSWAGPVSSTGAFGWATANGGTTGGHGADKAHTYTVKNRRELIMALYPDAVIHANGSWTSAKGADSTPKIIYIEGTINLSADGANRPLTAEDFKDPYYDFKAFVEAYKPAVWNANPANWDAPRKRPKQVSGELEDARVRSFENQARVVNIPVGSNTSLLGVGNNAKIMKGQIQLKGVRNVVIRNITFEDAFDNFPEWDPRDSFELVAQWSPLDMVDPGCQETYVDAKRGPQKCRGGRWNSEFDNIQIIDSKNVWVDHCSFNDGDNEMWKHPSVFEPPHVGVDFPVEHHDGAVDVTGASDFVTLSNNHFKNHDKTNLLGSSNTATPANGWGMLSITVANNWYENQGSRLPRVRFGKVHIYNNYVSGQIGYLTGLGPADTTTEIPNNRFRFVIGIGNFAKIYAENNVYDILDAPAAPKGLGVKVDDSVMFYHWYGKNDMVDGVLQKTYFHDTGTILNGKPRSIMAAGQALAVELKLPPLEPTASIWVPSSTYAYTLIPSEKVKAAIKDNVGAGKLSSDMCE